MGCAPVPPGADGLPSPAPPMEPTCCIEPAVGPEPSMVVAENLNIPLPKVELLKVARTEPWPAATPRPLLRVPKASLYVLWKLSAGDFMYIPRLPRACESNLKPPGAVPWAPFIPVPSPTEFMPRPKLGALAPLASLKMDSRSFGSSPHGRRPVRGDPGCPPGMKKRLERTPLPSWLASSGVRSQIEMLRPVSRGAVRP